MDDLRFGAAIRAARIRRGWTQARLAEAADVSASLVSLIERGHLETLSVRVLRRLAGALDARLDLGIRMRTGDIDRLLNAGHAALHEELARYLSDLPGWMQAPEVSFAIFGERGVIDILAFHRATSSLLVIELKTELVSFENLLTTMDVRVRLAKRIAADRGWLARTVSCWVVVAETAPNRRRVRQHRSLLDSAFPASGRDMRTWLKQPDQPVRAFSLWSISNGSGVKRPAALVRRVRMPKRPSNAA
jgi:transcriptional regulator with XRE-family HTH domain